VPPLPLANLGGSRLKLGHFGVETFRLLGVARQFCAVRAEEAHEGPSGSRLPRAVPRSRSRGVPAPQGNARRRALEDGAQQSSTGRSVELARAPLPAALSKKVPWRHVKNFRQAFERSKRGVAAAAFQMAEIGVVHATSLRNGSLG
jgi:hypothetical protein